MQEGEENNGQGMEGNLSLYSSSKGNVKTKSFKEVIMRHYICFLKR